MAKQFPNPIQRITIAGGALALVALALLPPWHEADSRGEIFKGFHWVFSPSDRGSNLFGATVDTGLLLTSIAVLLLIVGVFLLLFQGITWNPFSTARRVLFNKISAAIAAIVLLAGIGYVTAREIRIAKERTAFEKEHAEWLQRVRSGSETDIAKLTIPIDFSGQSILEWAGIKKYPYTFDSKWWAYYEEAERQIDALEGVKTPPNYAPLEDRARAEVGMQKLAKERGLPPNAPLAELYEVDQPASPKAQDIDLNSLPEEPPDTVSKDNHTTFNWNVALQHLDAQ